MFKRSALAVALFLAGTIDGLTAGNQPYLYELVQKQPYRTTYKALMREVQPPQDYLIEALEQRGSYRGLYSASEEIEAGGSTYRIALVCPANDSCAESGSAFLFTTDGRKAWAEIRDGDKPVAYLGNPDNALKQALDKTLDD